MVCRSSNDVWLSMYYTLNPMYNDFEVAFEAGGTAWPYVPDTEKACCTYATFMNTWAAGVEYKMGAERGALPAFAGCDVRDRPAFAAFATLMCAASKEQLAQVGLVFAAVNKTACSADLAAAVKQVGSSGSLTFACHHSSSAPACDSVCTD